MTDLEMVRALLEKLKNVKMYINTDTYVEIYSMDYQDNVYFEFDEKGNVIEMGW